VTTRASERAPNHESEFRIARQRSAPGRSLDADLPPVGHESWMDLFLHLARATAKGRWIVLFDEVSWMAGSDPEFLPKLKVVWDQHFKKNPELIWSTCFCMADSAALRRGL